MHSCFHNKLSVAVQRLWPWHKFIHELHAWPGWSRRASKHNCTWSLAVADHGKLCTRYKVNIPTIWASFQFKNLETSFQQKPFRHQITQWIKYSIYVFCLFQRLLNHTKAKVWHKSMLQAQSIFSSPRIPAGLQSGVIHALRSSSALITYNMVSLTQVWPMCTSIHRTSTN